MNQIRPFQVPMWELNLTDATAAAALNIVDGDLVGVKDVSTEDAANTFECGGDIILKVTATTAKTLTITNKTAAIAFVVKGLATPAGASLAASTGNTTVSLTAGTPTVLIISKSTAVADA